MEYPHTPRLSTEEEMATHADLLSRLDTLINDLAAQNVLCVVAVQMFDVCEPTEEDPRKNMICVAHNAGEPSDAGDLLRFVLTHDKTFGAAE